MSLSFVGSGLHVVTLGSPLGLVPGKGPSD